VYDLDGTILRRGSFTPFLLFAARRNRAWRIILAPAWFGAMALYKLGFFSRGALKQFGLRLFLGQQMTASRLEATSCAFAEIMVPGWVAQGALAAIASDRAQGRELVLATAAMEFYAADIGRRLGFDHVVASRIKPLAAEGSPCLLEGGNCFGINKRARVEALFAQLEWDRADCIVRFYTDSVNDAPLLDQVDEPVLVNAGALARRTAARRGWKLERFN
jgi:phosphoserine phosphatase